MFKHLLKAEPNLIQAVNPDSTKSLCILSDAVFNEGVI